jgi:hypothetical protein
MTYRAYPIEYVQRLEAQRSTWRFFAGLSAAGCLALGLPLSIVGQSHDAMVRERVEMKLAISR